MPAPTIPSIPSAAGPRTNRRRSPAWRWGIAVLVLAVLAALGYGFSQPIYRRVKRERGVALAREAGRALDAGDLAAAIRHAQTALRFAPGDPNVNRVAARVCGRTGQPTAMGYWMQVIASGQATHADWFEASELAVAFGRVDLSGPWLENLYRQSPHDLPVLRLMLRHLARMGDRDRVVQFARGILLEFPADPESELELGRILAADPDPGRKAEGQRLLWDVAAGNSAFRDPAVEALASGGDLGRAQGETLVRMIGSRTNASAGARLLALDLRARLDPASGPAVVAAALAMLPEAVSLADTGAVVRWLNRHGAIGEALPRLPLERCRTNPVLMAAHLDALVALDRTNDLERIAAEHPGPVNGPLVTAARGIVAVQHGRTADAEALFRDAVKARPRVAPVLLFVAAQAERAGLSAVALDAYGELLEVPGQTLDAGRQILRLARPLDDLTAARNTLRRMNAFMPGEEVLAGERAWLEALFGSEKDFAFNTLQRLAESRTNQLGWRYGFALASWRRGNPTAALALIDPMPVDWNAMEPRWQAVYVAVLGANDQREAARRFGRMLAVEKLHSQERALVEPWR